MNALDEIAVTGAPGILTALGMGTVFLCLTLLYATTRLVGIWLPRLLGWLPRLLRSAGAAAAVERVESATEGRAAALPAARREAPAGDEAIVAAMTLALARHRFSRLTPVEEPRGADPWKLAGRIRTLRVR